MNPELFQIGGSWVISAVVYLLAIVAIVVLVRYFPRIRAFSAEVKTELHKASWPWEPKEKGMKKYKELVDSTLLVVIAMFLLAGYVGLWDFLMLTMSGFLTKLATN